MKHRFQKFGFPHLFSLLLTIMVMVIIFRFGDLPVSPMRVDHQKSMITDPNAAVFFSDLNRNGVSEKLILKNPDDRFEPALKIYNEQEGLIGQWTFEEPWIANGWFTGDFNRDFTRECYVFTQKADTLFLYIIDYRDPRNGFIRFRRPMVIRPADGKHPTRTWDYIFEIAAMYDGDGDGYKDLLFGLASGNARLPRRFYLYSIKKDSVIARLPSTGAHVLAPKLVDLDGDRQPELLFKNVYAPGNITGGMSCNDERVYLFYTDQKLNFFFPPLPFGSRYSTLNAVPLGSDILVSLSHGRDVALQPRLMRIDRRGHLLQTQTLPPGRWNIAGTGWKNNYISYLINSSTQELFAVNNRLQRRKLFKGGDIGIYRALDLNKDQQPELLVRVQNNDKSYFALTDTSFSRLYPLSTGTLSLDADPVISVKNGLNGARRLAFYSGGNLYLFSYTANPLYPYAGLLGLLFFIPVYFVVLGALNLADHTLFYARYINQLFNRNRNGTVMLNRSGHIRRINGKMAGILNSTHYIHLGEHYTQAFADYPKIRAFMDDLLSGGRAEVEDYSMIREGHAFTGKLYGYPLAGLFPGVFAYIVELEDQTEMRNNDRALIWSKTIQDMAHKIKTPLSSIQVSLQTLKYKINDLAPHLSGKVSEDIALIDEELRRVRDLTRNFLKFASTEELRKEIVSLPDIVNKTLSHFSGYFNGDIRVSLELDEQHPLLEADPVQLESLLQTLIENAIDALNGNGDILITSQLAQLLEQPEKQFMEIEIADTGSGISREHLDQIFEPYFTTKAEGNGMGLAIARKIVSDHEGRLTVISRDRFATVFRIMLPIGNIAGENDA